VEERILVDDDQATGCAELREDGTEQRSVLDQIVEPIVLQDDRSTVQLGRRILIESLDDLVEQVPYRCGWGVSKRTPVAAPLTVS
jgi:hypothetical protein